MSLMTRSLAELIVTGEVGPRIIRYGFIDQDNEFCEYEEWLGLTGGDELRALVFLVIAGTVLMMIFPDIILYLPNKMY